MSTDRLEELVEKLRQKSEVATLPEDCFAMIRLPVAISTFAAFAEVAAKASPGSVTRQHGEWMLILHAPKKEVLP